MNPEQSTHLIEKNVTSSLLTNGQQTWDNLCDLNDIPPDSGICVNYQNQQVALFYISSKNKVYAVSNYDPIGKANVISRGIIGSIDDKLVVASPLFKLHFDLVKGGCIEDPLFNLLVYEVKVADGKVKIQNVL